MTYIIKELFMYKNNRFFLSCLAFNLEMNVKQRNSCTNFKIYSILIIKKWDTIIIVGFMKKKPFFIIFVVDNFISTDLKTCT